MAVVRTIDNPFPPIVPVQPRTTAELIAANPRVQGHSFENETPYAEQWHLGAERQLFSSMLVELTYVGSAGKHLVLCYNPNEIQPGTTSQAARRLLQPIRDLTNMLQCDPRNRSTYHAGTLKVQQRFSGGLQFLVSYTYGKALDYGGSAASGGGAVGNGQTITNIDAWHGPAGFDTRHRAVISYVYELPWGPEDMARRRRYPWRRRGRMAARRHHDDDDRPSVHGDATDRRQQRRPKLAESNRSGHPREPHGRHVVQYRRFRRAAAEHLRRFRAWHPLRAGPRQLRHVVVEAVRESAEATRSSAGMLSICSTIRASASRTVPLGMRPPGASRRQSSTIEACSLR